MRVDDVHRKLTPEHFADGRVPSRSTVSERLAGVGLHRDFIEAIADVCSQDAVGRDRLLAQADSARRHAVVNAPKEADTGVALENQLVIVQQRSIAVSDKLVRAMERASQLERERNEANQMVFVLLAMVDKLHRDIDALVRERDRIHDASSVHVELEEVQEHLVRSEQQRVTAEAELERARAEREKADRLAEEAAEQVHLLTEELARLRGQVPGPDTDSSPPPQAVAPDLRNALGGTTDDIELALIKAARHLDDRADRLDQLASEIHLDNPPDNSPALEVTVDNTSEAGYSLIPEPSAAVSVSTPIGPSAFEAFCRMHYPAYLAWARTYLGTEADAADAVSLALEELLRHWTDVLKMASPEAGAWQLMKARIRQFAEGRGWDEALMQSVIDSEALRDAVDPGKQVKETLRLFLAITTLPEKQHDVVILVHIHGYSIENAAYHLGMGHGTVRHLDLQARRAIRRDLGIVR
ncbi:hypothetical protein HTV45_09800 [Streptomyces sp. CHD11]|uniref:RNA polymerase sigma factor n=1 Tax=Streptomyces sp. CHD11 TaxID=2741325 RepID=UPI001BFC46FF|nr:sigma-70 family RNA polymerase sigma factor [Streptomyces sp. CHD11]MBT3151177.1 hypothetical protein [Streptomyces sp. CHD11]